MKQLQKRYQYWSRKGIVWTKWFNCIKRTKRAIKSLKEEYRYIEINKNGEVVVQ